jgi:hypothetical protein
MDRWAGMKEPWHFIERLDSYYYDLRGDKLRAGGSPRILGTDVRQLGLRLTLDAAMLGVGGLMGIRVATSCMLGAFINFAVLAPIMIQRGDIKAYTSRGRARGDLARRNRQPVVPLVGRGDDGGGLARESAREAGAVYRTRSNRCANAPAPQPRRRSRPTIRSRTSSCRCGCRLSACRSSACSARG